MGRIYTYKELYIVETRAADVAKLVLGLRSNGRDKNGGELPLDEIAYIKASPDMWHERGLGSKASPGEVIAEEFTKVGLNVERADNRRVLGWTRMREYLSDAPDGKPWWQIFDTCTHLVRTLPELSFDKNHVEDVSDNCEDHAPESCRYGLMSRPSPNEGSSFLPGSAEYYRSSDTSTDDEEDDDYQDSLGGDEGMGFYGI